MQWADWCLKCVCLFSTFGGCAQWEDIDVLFVCSTPPKWVELKLIISLAEEFHIWPLSKCARSLACSLARSLPLSVTLVLSVGNSHGLREFWCCYFVHRPEDIPTKWIPCSNLLGGICGVPALLSYGPHIRREVLILFYGLPLISNENDVWDDQIEPNS